MGTATSNRKADTKILELDGAVGGTAGTRYGLGKFFRKKTVPVNLATIREVTVVGETADLLTDVDFGGTADKGFGLLGESTTPKLTSDSGAAGALRLEWASSGNQPIVVGVDLEDIDTDEDLLILIRCAMASGGTDTPVIDADSYFNEGDTKVEDASDALNTTYTERKITIASSDIPSDAAILGFELTPAAHTNEALYITRIHVEYTLKLPLSD